MVGLPGGEMTGYQCHMHTLNRPRCFLTVLKISDTCMNSCRVVFLLLNITTPLLSVVSRIVMQYGVPISS